VGTIQDIQRENGVSAGDTRGYLSGFGNELQSEAIAGALPVGQNSPKVPPMGLISELVSGTAFSAPRAYNRRTYMFRIRPSVVHGAFSQFEQPAFLTAPLALPPDPNQMRWDPWPLDVVDGDFFEGITTICGNGSPAEQAGMCIHVYRANKAMGRRYFMNSDGELLIIAEQGRLSLATELGQLQIEPGEIALIPRGIKFKADPLDGSARGFICENYGLPFRLPELGLIGSNGLANSADFEIPQAAFEVTDEPCELINKFCGRFWSAALDHSPLDVVAWRGSYLPAKFDMRRFVPIGTATVDHPDPSIFCALTSPSDSVLGGNADFLILPPRWLVAENSFRPPGFHRNCVAEFLAIVAGKHDAKAHGFQPGGASLHNHWSAHGPDAETFEAARLASEEPRKLEDTLVFMIETRRPLQLSPAAAQAPHLQKNYREAWQGIPVRFSGS
jgi:homogentisate 1,2-dioxygenase